MPIQEIYVVDGVVVGFDSSTGFYSVTYGGVTSRGIPSEALAVQIADNIAASIKAPPEPPPVTPAEPLNVPTGWVKVYSVGAVYVYRITASGFYGILWNNHSSQGFPTYDMAVQIANNVASSANLADLLAVIGEGWVPQEVYRTVQIFYNPEFKRFGFVFNNVAYKEYESAEDARASIDALLYSGGAVVTPVTEGAFPYWLKWLKPVLDWGADAIDAAVNYWAGLQVAANDAVKSIERSVGGIWSGVKDNLGDWISGVLDTGADETSKRVESVMSGSPNWAPRIVPKFTGQQQSTVTKYAALLNPTGYLFDTSKPEDVVASGNKAKMALVGTMTGEMTLATLSEIATLGQVDAFIAITNKIIDVMGVNDVSKALFSMPLSKSLLKSYEYSLNAQYVPEIPNYNDLVNMRVKEKITEVEFKGFLSLQGYSNFWAGKIWDAHFNAPNLNDVLTAWRRGSIDEARVDELMVLIDLDPFYKGVFDTRKYIDPPVNMARFMFETGAINSDRVADLVHRAGYSESDAKAVVDYILKFQERRYRTRILTALATGRAYGAFNDEDIRAEVKALGQTDAVADLIIRLADVRAKTEMARITHPKPRLLSLGELKRGFMHNVVDEDAIRTELLTRGYELGQVDLLVSVMNADKVVDVAGGKKAALTVSELKQAFQYSEIGEDALRQTLLLRGLDLSEVDMLINTWKKSWGVVSA
jgi:hypothetical protein